MTQGDLFFVISYKIHIWVISSQIRRNGLDAHALAESHVEMFAIDAHTVLKEWLK